MSKPDDSVKIKTETIAPDSDAAVGRFMKGFSCGSDGSAGKGIDLENRTIPGIASTINLDRDGEIVHPKAFEKTIETFRRSHAPFLSAHTHRTLDGRPPQIGWVVEISMRDTEIPCTFRFSRTSIAEEWWQLASDPGGKGIAFSIGFIPKRRMTGSVRDLVAGMPELAEVFRRADLGDGDRVVVYTEIELLEISAVPVPSNRESLQSIARRFFAGAGDEAGATEDPAELARMLGKEIADGLAKSIGDALAAAIEERLKEFDRRLDEGLADLREMLSEDASYGCGDGSSRATSRPDGTDGSGPADPEPVSHVEPDALKRARRELLDLVAG